MKYEAPKVEVVRFDGNYFMAFSGNFACLPYDAADPSNCQNYTDNSTGSHCNGFNKSSYCGNFSYNGNTCYGFNGSSGSVNGSWYDNAPPARNIF